MSFDRWVVFEGGAQLQVINNIYSILVIPHINFFSKYLFDVLIESRSATARQKRDLFKFDLSACTVAARPYMHKFYFDWHCKSMLTQNGKTV